MAVAEEQCHYPGPLYIKEVRAPPLFARSFREQKAMPLVNHAFPNITTAIFVSFVVFTGSEQQSPCFTG